MLKVDINGKQPGKIIWASDKSAEFYGHNNVNLKKRSINSLMTRRVAKLHNLFVEDSLRGAPSEKIFGTTGLVFKLGNGYLDRRICTVKPFFMHTSVHIIYMIYAEMETKSQHSLITLDSKGFFEGATWQAALMVGFVSLKSIASNLASIFFYFPALVDVFYYISPDFAQLFEPVPDFHPSVAIDPCPDGPNCYFVTVELKPMPAKSAKLFEMIVLSLLDSQKKLSFEDFKNKVFQFSRLAHSTLNFNLKIQLTKCGFEHSFVKMETLSTDLIDSNDPILKSDRHKASLHSRDSHKRDSKISHPRITFAAPSAASCEAEDSNEEIDARNKELEDNPLRHLGYLKVVGKSLKDVSEETEENLLEAEIPVPKTKIEHENSSVSIVKQNDKNPVIKQHARLTNLLGSNHNNIDFRTDCKGESAEDYKTNHMSVRSGKCDNFTTEFHIDLKSKDEIFDYQNSSLASSETSKSTDGHDSYSEQLNKELKRPHTTKYVLITIFVVPLVQFAFLFLMSQKSLKSNFYQIGELNIQGFFYAMLVETSFCISLLAKLITLRPYPNSGERIGQLSTILTDDFNVFLTQLYSENWSASGTVLETIKANFDKFHLFLLEASKVNENLVNSFVDFYTNNTSYETLIKTHKSLPDLYQSTPNFWGLLLPFLIVSALALATVLWVLVLKIR